MLGQLGVSKVDLCLMHWPGLCSWDTTDSEPLASPAAFQGKASSWIEFCGNIAPAWANMLQLKADDLVGQVGTSNFYEHHLDELAKQCSGVPFANEVFIDTSNQEAAFVDEMHKRSIRVLAYRPVIYKPFPDAVQKVAARLGVSAQTTVLAWLLKRGIYPLVKCRGAHVIENFTSPAELQAKLSEDDLVELATAEVGLRLSAEWFAKTWKFHNETGVSEEDVQMLVGLGVEEAKARACLEKCGGNVDAAMDAAFS